MKAPRPLYSKAISFFTIFLLSSCVIPGKYSGYEKLSAEDQKRVVSLDEKTDLETLKRDDKLYEISAKQLLSSLNKHETSLMYITNPNCSAPQCISPVLVEEYCKKRDIKFYYIATTYADFKFTSKTRGEIVFLLDFLPAALETAILEIKRDAYNTNKKSKYLKAFVKDLTGNENENPLFYLFKNKQLVQS